MENTNTKLAPGFYLGVRRATRNFSFTVPKIGQGFVETDMDKWFNQLNTGKRVTSSTPSNNPTTEKSTSFSGWFSTDNAANLSPKCLAAPEIYKAAGGSDPSQANEMVKAFKQKAASVLSRCSETKEAITEATAAEINTKSCIVHEIKVVLLRVSDKEQPGSRHDQNTGLWYQEKTVRKFYLPDGPGDELLKAFAKELADPNTTVNAERKLVAIREDRATKGGSKHSSFSIVSVSDEKAMETDAALMAAVKRIINAQRH